jgi:hypothetical protein
MLEKWAPKFRAANTNRRDAIVEEAADGIKRMWTEDTEFDRDRVISVCKLSAKLCYSHISIAHLRTLVPQSETEIEKIRIRNAKMDVP